MLFLARSNALLRLADQLAEVLRKPGLAPLEAEIVLIQSAGIQRWLSRELSSRLGVLAGARFPFPRAYIREVLDRVLGVAPQAERYEREQLTWLLFRLLGQPRAGDAFAQVSNFLREDADGSQRLFLAERLAHLFDQYLLYRPRLIAGWERGAEPQDFQAILWREIVAELGPHHFAERVRLLFDEVSDQELGRHLPSRISLVGGPGLPPRFLEIFSRWSRATDVHLFSFTVCEQYFADAHLLEEPLLSDEEGLHPLLVSLGRVGADYQKLLESFEYSEVDGQFSPAVRETVLAHLQRDILAGRVRPEAERLSSALREEESITLDACHSPLREVEVLRDRLLRYFSEDPSLRPEDIVVLAPSIEEYSPYISAVFGTPSSSLPQLSFRIADRNEKSENLAVIAFIQALRVLQGRLPASAMIDLLQMEPVRLRFGIELSSISRIRHWVTESGIRWGADREHKQSYGLLEDELNTWRHGIRRLLLGWMMADEAGGVFHGAVPFDDVAAGDAKLLEGFCEWCECLLDARSRLGLGDLRAQKSPVEWFAQLGEFARAILAPHPDDAWSLSVIFSAIEEIQKRARASEIGEPVGFSVCLHLLELEFESRKPSTDFLAGGITFCELLPLRTIPFRVVCVLGLNQGEFPRTDRALGYDKMAEKVEIGDRSIRADDRYLFLEMLLAAQDRIALSYVGQSIQDNSEKPPSVVVTELGQVIESMFTPRQPEDREYLEPLRHPLQPFHPSYFEDPRARLSSPSEEWRRAAEALRSSEKKEFVFAPPDLFLPQETPPFIELEELVRFFANPPAAFLRGLGVGLSDEIERLEDREPVILNGLDRYRLGELALNEEVQRERSSGELELLRGHFPAGVPGRIQRDEVYSIARGLGDLARSYRERDKKNPSYFSLPVELTSGETVEVRGVLDRVWGSTRVVVSYGRVNAKRRLAEWIRHVVASLVPGAPVTESVWIARSSEDQPQLSTWSAVEPMRAKLLLGEWVDWFVRGKRRPLRFHPEASWNALQRWRNLEKKAKGELDEEWVRAILREEAEKALFGGFSVAGADTQDAHFEQVFGAEDPFGFQEQPDGALRDLPFLSVSSRIWQPFLDHTGGEA